MAVIACLMLFLATRSRQEDRVAQTAKAPGQALSGPAGQLSQGESDSEEGSPVSQPALSSSVGRLSQKEKESNNPAAGSSKYAKSLEEAERAIVKFVVPLGIGNLSRHGTGFLIDERGWIATSYHVVAEANSETRVKLSDGRLLELDGLISKLPQHDLAIVKIKDPPTDLTLLDVKHQEDVGLGEEVFAFGHPYDAEFSLSKGIVSRILTTDEWSQTARRQLAKRLEAPDEMVWIQHDAKISPGNSGGPLLDDHARVFGLNTFVHLKTEFGYASHVDYLRALIESGAGELEPFPDARSKFQAAVSTARMRELFEHIEAFDWLPETTEQYDELAELAKQLTLAKHALLTGKNRSEEQRDTISRVAKVADERFAALSKVRWDQRRLNAINSFSDPSIGNAGEGFFTLCSVLGNSEKQGALLVRIEGTGETVLVKGGSKIAKIPRDTRCVVVGLSLPQVVKVQTKQRTLNHQTPVVLSHYLLLVGQGSRR